MYLMLGVWRWTAILSITTILLHAFEGASAAPCSCHICKDPHVTTCDHFTYRVDWPAGATHTLMKDSPDSFHVHATTIPYKQSSYTKLDTVEFYCGGSNTFSVNMADHSITLVSGTVHAAQKMYNEPRNEGTEERLLDEDDADAALEEATRKKNSRKKGTSVDVGYSDSANQISIVSENGLKVIRCGGVGVDLVLEASRCITIVAISNWAGQLVGKCGDFDGSASNDITFA